ncbi:MAG: UDP-N-acetylglucosamine 2-epimerase (non-hydrolyzing) [Cyanobacteria bacterium]|nr:UDP-N-acetylglucosamine 2-epimerase (non-hydrolyzing) [Cyanobacteriota bacterium]
MPDHKRLKIFVVAGTRPELIKVYPAYKAFQERSQTSMSPGTDIRHQLEVKWVSTGQHPDLVQDLYHFFDIKPDHEFTITKSEDPDLQLASLSSQIMTQASELFLREKPDLVIVQGDTLTAQQVGLAAFYQKIKVAHIEAGIRTNNIHSPFPEELARRILSQISDLNFAPSQTALINLEAEKVMHKKSSFNFYTGNTVVDALEYSKTRITDDDFDWSEFKFSRLAFYPDLEYDLIKILEKLAGKKIILVTAHRRENIGQAHQNLANAIHRLATESSQELEFIISVHKNPQARKAFEDLQETVTKEALTNVRILDAINYPLFLKLMMASYCIVTDSGGIQEEAPYLGKPVLVFRNETERVEGIEAGLASLIGTEEHVVHGAILELINDPAVYNSMIQEGLQPYGDGLAGTRIADVSLLYLKKR